MQKRHFEIIARAIKTRLSFVGPEEQKTLRGMADSFCDEFARVNPEFKPSRFLTACGF